MKSEYHTSLPARRLRLILLVLVVVFLLLRFIDLESDFPPDVSWSGMLYTDEGWYAKAAVRQCLFGQWYHSAPP